MKSSANLDNVDLGQRTVYGSYCAFALAAGHARSGDAAAIAGYLGTSDVLDRTILAFAEAYADQNEIDHVHFSSRVEAKDEGAAKTALVRTQVGIEADRIS